MSSVSLASKFAHLLRALTKKELPTVHPLREAWKPLGTAFLVSLSGCPGSAELEDPRRFYPALTGTGGAASGGVPNIGGLGGLPECDWPEALRASCVNTVCHGTVNYANLNLTADDGLIARIKDVPVTLLDVDCDPSNTVYRECIPPDPPECQPFATNLLIDSEHPEESFLIKKLHDIGCGNVMPLPPGNSPQRGWNQERLDCLTNLFLAVAKLP